MAYQIDSQMFNSLNFPNSNQMNTSKIAALYDSTHLSYIFNNEGKPGQPAYINLRTAVRLIEGEELSQVDAEGYDYRMDASRLNDRGSYCNEIGDRRAGFIDTFCSPRMAAWVRNQFANPEQDVDNLRVGHDDLYLVTVWGYNSDKDKATKGFLRYGSQEDLAKVIRGMAAYERKAQKRSRKLVAQFRAYHQQRLAEAAAAEAAQLKRGVWLGAEKAITTAARVNEPSVPFMGDAGLSYEQRKAMDLRYFAINEYIHGTCAAFPVGTGIALKPVKRSRELQDGAMYLWQWELNGRVEMQVLGRLDMSAKERGHHPLRMEDTGKIADFCWSSFNNESVKLYRVTHYTTRPEAVLPTPKRARSSKSRQRTKVAA